ncbi:uncharacterized protein LOC100570333 isoform X1 [Acyrthosiphon pisum]|uniref:TNF family profile domain-containing protein n=1 Tax=Acyrthosiphon pisum TaxID=7029 RepID=A0A8R2H5E9_ACYPI|nr:uncharacterized protein LOC100570333 isoform X1 [Acyrthosiphon pisum]XP_016659506.1 uncharacterized protein LOC100570333 isoform X1 [Acyrthosiphon pisum]|eukprot:XP_016659505.1 PREDICTED: uncharacterized protein LOC100570333 isoform X1 [Acyrthosiphon pisum]
MNKMNNNSYYLKRKDITVIFVNLLVLSLVIYIYHVVDDLKTMLSNERLCILKTSSKTDLTDGDINEIYFDFSKMKNLNIRHTRSTKSTKFQNMCLFYLAQPNIDFEQNGSILGPWILSNKSLPVDSYSPVKLTSRRTLIEIVDPGLYLVYIQVYYLSSAKKNSFSMTKVTADLNETLSVCSAVGVSGTEISCFTSIVEYFKPGESILIRLREMSTGVNLNRKASHTYLGFTKLL